MVLKAKVLKANGITTTENPDILVGQKSDEEILDGIDQIADDTVKFSEWRRVEVEKRGRKFKRMQVVVVEKSKTDFREIMKKELAEFRLHIERVKIQYAQSRKLKEVLPTDHAICHMDFAENYICVHAEEVQSAYFDKGTVTLHPVVIYTKDTTSGELKHKSYVYVSDETSHTATTVFAIMKSIVIEVKSLLPNVKMIHYMTDSPTSQYRNKHIFYVVANHDTLFDNVQCSWLYFEAGHGKGPCDGVGGTAKRLADMALKRQAAIIQSADDFYNWGKSQEDSNLQYVYVSKSKCDAAKEELSKIEVKPIKGTLHVHAVVPLGQSRIAVRNTSCFCSHCFEDGHFTKSCSGWTEHDLINSEHGVSVQTTNDGSKDTSEKADANEEIRVTEMSANTSGNGHGESLTKDTFVAAVYDSKWYIGKILEHDTKDNEYHISFKIRLSGRKTPTVFGFQRRMFRVQSVSRFRAKPGNFINSTNAT